MRRWRDRMMVRVAAVVAAVGAGVAGGFGGGRAWGLEAGEVAVVFNTKSAGSLAVARYYMKARQIPANHLVPLTCEVSENISEELYRTSVVPQLLKALGERKLLADAPAGVPGVKCLVTTFDVPLRVQAREATAVEKAEIAEDQKLLEEDLVDLLDHVRLYDLLGVGGVAGTMPGGSQTARAATSPGTAAGQPTRASAPLAAPPATGEKPTWRQAVTQLEAAARAAGRRIDALREPERGKAMALFMALQEHVGGAVGVLNSMSVPADAPDGDAARRHLAELAAQLREAQGQAQALMKQRDSARMRQEIVRLRLQGEGIIGQAAALEGMIQYLQPEQTAACFDNELALLPADQSYSRAMWVMNPKSVENYTPAARAAGTGGGVLATVMVCRLDGSTVAKVEEMIDTGLKVEAKGLEGKMYLDARGLWGTDAYAVFDADLRRTAEWMKQHSTMETVLDDTPNLFVAKDAPEAAVYCGWYSVGNYQESCQSVKGAVGYHVASFEMMSLHNPAEKGWVVNLLNRGFCGTLGPTDEPYLQSFPKPSLFFPLLLSGEFTQGEVWEVTTPMLSWRQGYVGDPLYNPFKAKPRVKVEDVRSDLVMRKAFEILGR